MVTSEEIRRKLRAKHKGKYNVENRKTNDDILNNFDNGIVCPNCGAQNLVNAVFCQECGNKLSEKINFNQEIKPERGPVTTTEGNPDIEQENIVCSDCGAQNRLNAEFCRECGKKLGANQDTGFNVTDDKTEKIQHNPVSSSGDFFADEKKGRERNLIISGIAIMAFALLMSILAINYLNRFYFLMIFLFLLGLYTFYKGLK